MVRTWRQNAIDSEQAEEELGKLEKTDKLIPYYKYHYMTGILVVCPEADCERLGQRVAEFILAQGHEMNFLEQLSFIARVVNAQRGEDDKRNRAKRNIARLVFDHWMDMPKQGLVFEYKKDCIKKIADLFPTEGSLPVALRETLSALAQTRVHKSVLANAPHLAA